MGARAAEEDKAKDLGTLYHEPTIKPGLGSSRCPRCFSPISNNSVPSLNPKPYYTHGRPKLNFIVLFQVYILIIQQDISGWTMAPVVRDTFTMVGTTAGGTLGAFHGFNRVMPFVQSCVRGPMWLHFFIGIPPIMFWSLGWAAFGGTALPAFAQVSISSYYAASATSHYSISQLTRRIESFATRNLSRNEFSKHPDSRQ
ncbi:uncharacterized protein LOC131054147 isoform X1 [Cryptomeria japonica]|uniref:uncharacterized protein LOC131054147 isoform X1 n=1 Tax=Cryptomeria japonica TaxID=3369 RepID=UPI0027DA3DAD|nr:uncharacterized protein LOC131054147 isoform X1 [Cryptomeria japonica]